MINNLFPAIRETTDQYALVEHPLLDSDKLILNRLRTVFEKGHTIYCFIKYRELFEQNKQLKEEGKGDSLTGGMIGLLATEYGCSNLVVYGLIIKCIDDLFQQQLAVFKAWDTLQEAKRHKIETFIETEHQRNKDSYLFPPPSIHLRIEQDVLPLYRQCKLIMQCWLKIIWEVIKLSFITRDVYLITTPGSQARFRACTELAATILKHKDKLINDNEFLKEQLTNRLIQLNEILRKLNAPEVPQSLLDATIKTAEYVPAAFETLQDIFSSNDFYRGGKVIGVSLVSKQGKAPDLNPSAYSYSE